jgi:probable rRNA maturation factor
MDPDGHRRTVRVLVSDGRGRRVGAAGLARWLTRIAPARARGLVNIAIVSDSHVRRLNRRFRGVNKPTDVLSFPSSGQRVGSPAWRVPSPEPRVQSPELRAARILGDIVIARGVARRQAREAGHSEMKEWRVLALHGLLHLIGYDHERDDGRMRRVERRLRRKGGLREGLIDRVGPLSQGHRNAGPKGPRDK